MGGGADDDDAPPPVLGLVVAEGLPFTSFAGMAAAEAGVDCSYDGGFSSGWGGGGGGGGGVEVPGRSHTDFPLPCST